MADKIATGDLSRRDFIRMGLIAAAAGIAAPGVVLGQTDKGRPETQQEEMQQMTDAGRKPNIILVNCDDLGYGDVGCYGSTVHSTPAIDRMAKEGVRFTDFYMVAAFCSASRAGMMTGCYAQRINMMRGGSHAVIKPGDSVGLHPDEVTLADVLRDAGYATGMIGKWHCGDQPEFLPTSHGFDSWFGMPYSNDMGMAKKTPDLPPLPLMVGNEVIEEQPDQAALTERYMAEALKFIRENRSRPFFLYFAHMYVHVPLYAPERFIAQSRNGKYGATVEHIDYCMDRLFYELRRLGLDDNTLVIFTSDNGGVPDYGGSNLPLRGKKGQIWEGGIRVPCVMRWPGKIPAGLVCSEIAGAMDFLPTFAQVSGGKTPDDRVIDGRDILPLMTEANAKTPHDAFYYFRPGGMCAVRSGDWKLMLKEKELYNLREDIGETTNVAEAHPERVAELEKLADIGRHDMGDELAGIAGANTRPCGRVDNPKPLTQFDPNHPYMVALYD